MNKVHNDVAVRGPEMYPPTVRPTLPAVMRCDVCNMTTLNLALHANCAADAAYVARLHAAATGMVGY